MNQREQELWRDPEHWRWKLFYHCAADKRIVVPKRGGWGWTLNFGHRSTWLVLIATLLAATVPIWAAVRDGQADQLPQAIAFSILAVVVIAVCARRIGRN